MKIKAFNKNKKTKNFLIGGVIFLTISIIGITIYKSFALYQEEATYNVLRGVVPEFSNGDIELAYTLNGQKTTKAFPKKGGYYKVNTLTCENGVTANWDNTNWGLININAGENTKIKCNIDFKAYRATEYITNLATTSEEIVDDETEDHNLRYMGSDPNNYISFNGELWRIIGVMNDVADDNGAIEPRVKLIRNESIGDYSWDNKPSGTGSSTSSYGSNDWTDSVIQEVLNNGAYYNRTSGSCPYGKEGATKACDFSESGLTSEAKNMISKVVWKLGGWSTKDIIANQYYEYERGRTVYSGRPTEWAGEVGLMYPSDYGYATGGGSTTDRSTCLSTSLYSWNGSECKHNDWLKYESGQLTIMPYSSNNASVFSVSMAGYLNFGGASYWDAIRPVVYLSTSTTIVSGTGTSIDPFILGA